MFVLLFEIESPCITQHALKLPLSPSAGITGMHHHEKVKSIMAVRSNIVFFLGLCVCDLELFSFSFPILLPHISSKIKKIFILHFFLV